MSMDSLKDLYVEELKDLYNAENQLLKALPKMAKKASAPELTRAFQDHLVQTEGHVNRLEKIFKGLGEKPTGKTCNAMKGLVEEGKEIIEEDGEESIRPGIEARFSRTSHPDRRAREPSGKDFQGTR